MAFWKATNTLLATAKWRPFGEVSQSVKHNLFGRDGCGLAVTLYVPTSSSAGYLALTDDYQKPCGLEVLSSAHSRQAWFKTTLTFCLRSLILTNPNGNSKAGSFFGVSVAGLSDAMCRYTARQTYLASEARLLNKCMKNDELLNSIYNDVKALGFVSNQYDFSVLCGRTPAWFSTIKARRLPITADAYLTLSFNIKSKAASIVDATIYHNALMLSSRLLEQAQTQVGEKASRFKACSF